MAADTPVADNQSALTPESPDENSRLRSARLPYCLAGCCTAGMADQLLLFLIPLLVYRATGSVAKAGLAFAIEWLPRILSLPLAGVLTDRLGSAHLYVGVTLVRGAACGLAFGALSGGWASPFLALTLLAAVVGALYEQAYVAVEVSIPRYVGSDDVPKAQALLQVLEQLSQILGPAVAAVLAGLIGAKLLMVSAALFAISSVLVWTGAPNVSAPGSCAGFLRELLVAARTVGSRQELILLIAVTMVINFLLSLVMASSAALTTGHFARADHDFGVLSSTAAVASITTYATIPALLRCVSLARLGTLAYAAITAAAVVIGVAPSFGVFFAAFVLLQAADAVFNIYVRTQRLRLLPPDLPPEQLGKTLGLIVLLNFLPLPWGGALMSALGDVWGAQAVVLGAALLTLAGIPLLAFQGER